MRYVVLSDVHANLHALEAVLSAAEQLRPDAYLSLGDAVGYGPFPNECVAQLASSRATCVLGNHELIALERLPATRCTPSARASLDWTRAQLTDRTRAILDGQPLHARVGSMLLAHGSPQDPEEYVRGAAAASGHLHRLREEEPGARLLLLGHTHEQWAFGARSGTLVHQATGTVELRADEPVLINPGSVGQSRDNRVTARFAVLDLGSDQDGAGRDRVTFHEVGYDVAACRAALRERGLPVDSCHVRPPRRERARAVARRLLTGPGGRR